MWWESAVVGAAVAVAAVAVAGKVYRSATGKGKSCGGGACGKCPTPKRRPKKEPQRPAASDDERRQ